MIGWLGVICPIGAIIGWFISFVTIKIICRKEKYVGGITMYVLKKVRIKDSKILSQSSCMLPVIALSWINKDINDAKNISDDAKVTYDNNHWMLVLEYTVDKEKFGVSYTLTQETMLQIDIEGSRKEIAEHDKYNS